MSRSPPEIASDKKLSLVQWQTMLGDDDALMAMPGAHHKVLLTYARALHQGRLISADDLSDMLEFADAALAFAVESLLDIKSDE